MFLISSLFKHLLYYLNDGFDFLIIHREVYFKFLLRFIIFHNLILLLIIFFYICKIGQKIANLYYTLNCILLTINKSNTQKRLQRFFKFIFSAIVLYFFSKILHVAKKVKSQSLKLYEKYHYENVLISYTIFYN